MPCFSFAQLKNSCFWSNFILVGLRSTLTDLKDSGTTMHYWVPKSTTRPDRSETFQVECVMRVMEAHSVWAFSLVGLSYGSFVEYRLAAQYKEAVERVEICCAPVCMEEKDLQGGVFRVLDLDEATSILVLQKSNKLWELVKYTFFSRRRWGLCRRACSEISSSKTVEKFSILYQSHSSVPALFGLDRESR